MEHQYKTMRGGQAPPAGQWYNHQYQYNNPPPPPPPPPNQQWGPPPTHPYPSQTHFPPPPYPYRPPPHHPHQDWGNTNWGHHQGWEYPARQDEEDWAAKARAWAASKDASDTQHPQSQFAPVSRIEGQSPFHDPYQQPVESHYADVQTSNPSPGYHQYPAPGVPSQRPPPINPQEYTANNSGPSSLIPDEHVGYSAKDRRFSGESNAVYHHQESSSVSSLVHMQEVPSSYSSVTGDVETVDGRERLYKSFPYPTDSTQVPFHDYLPPPPVGRSALMERPHYGVSNHATELTIDLSDRPLSFTHRSSFDHEQMMQQNNNNNDPGRHVRGVDPVSGAPSHYSLTSAHLPGTAYSPYPPVPSSAQQHGPSASLTSSFHGHSTSSFGMISGPSFQSSIPAIGLTNSLHPTTVFPGDIYGVLSGSDRPKKAPVPDWLKEEIIKNKAILASSGSERPTGSIEDETFDKTPGRADQEDSQSIGSPRSAVEEDEEDNMEAVRTAEVNQEIKRILTEVLLKVTDELFDEIATQVLGEDLSAQVGQETVSLDHRPSFAVPAAPTSQASAKILVSAKAKEIENEESGKSTSNSPGDLLGLASYASDNDDDDDSCVKHQPSTKKTLEDDDAAENGNAGSNFERDNTSQVHGNNYECNLVSNGHTVHDGAIGNMYNNCNLISNGGTVHDGAISTLYNKLVTSERSFDGSPKYPFNAVSGFVADDTNFQRIKTMETAGTSKPNNSVGEKVLKTEENQDVSAKRPAADESSGEKTRNKQDKHDGVGETGNNNVGRDIVNAGDGRKDRKGGNGNESLRRNDERYEDGGKDRKDWIGSGSLRRNDERHEKRASTTDKNNVSKERMTELSGKSGEKSKESDLKKRSSDPDGKMDKKDKEKDIRANDKDSDRRREREKDEKEERSRDTRRSESSRHRTRRSPSAGSRGRSNKGKYSSDESSADLKRKLDTKKRNLSRSPSPSRFRKRQYSRSPPSKRSHRRHSPFSSLDTNRGRRSRSRSPARRHR